MSYADAIAGKLDDVPAWSGRDLHGHLVCSGSQVISSPVSWRTDAKTNDIRDMPICRAGFVRDRRAHRFAQPCKGKQCDDGQVEQPSYEVADICLCHGSAGIKRLQDSRIHRGCPSYPWAGRRIQGSWEICKAAMLSVSV